MSTKENKELVRQLTKGRNEFAGDAAKVRSWCKKYNAPGYIYHNLARGDLNQEQTIKYYVELMSATPDFSKSIDDIVAEGDKVVTTNTIRATSKGMFMGIPPNGKQLVIKEVDIYKIKSGKILEWWDFPDCLSLLTQAGAMPAPKI
jgi:predicted ester cyclase